MAKPSKTHSPFSAHDAERLDNLLDPLLEHGALPLEAIDGLLSAVVVGPELIQPSEWLPAILGGQAEPWRNEAEAKDFIDLLMRFYNHIADRVVPEPDDDTPIPFIGIPEGCEDMDDAELDALDLTIGGYWAVGFMIGVSLRNEAWDALATSNEDILGDLEMIVALLPEQEQDDDSDPDGEDNPGDQIDDDTDDANGADDQRPLSTTERLDIISDLAGALHDLNRARLQSLNSQQPARREIKPGRNDACPCGSGQKFKKCHGASIH